MTRAVAPTLWRLVRRGMAAQPGVASVSRPVVPGGDARFDLAYVRSGPRAETPLLVIPGGPGAASIQVYRSLRAQAAERGLDVLMVEHRGVGMSRHDPAGVDLPPEALTIGQVVDDLAAVLDDAGVERAVVYGTSYGSYLAAGFGVRHPDRVAAMVLDSPVLSHRDIDDVRRAVRDLLWDGDGPLAPKVRRLADDGLLTSSTTQLATTLYEFGGAHVLGRQLDLLLRGRCLLWSAMGLVGRLAERRAPYANEADLVGPIGFRELDFGAVPDGLPLDPAVALRDTATATPPFEGEPFDLVAALPTFEWPTAVISGGRDLTTPPSVARRVAELVPGAVLVTLPTAGHSTLDTREAAALRIAEAAVAGRLADLADAGADLDELPGSTAIRWAVGAVDAAARLEGLLPVRR